MATREETADRRRRVVELTRQGLGLVVIAEILGTTARTVSRDRLACGIARPWRAPTVLSEEQQAIADRLLEDGASPTEVSRTLGVGRNYIQRRYRSYAWNHAQMAEYMTLCRRMRSLEQKANIK